MDTLRDKRDLPIFIHSEIDDMTDITPNAMRVYFHLARRADKGGRAWPSYQSIGDHCFASVSDNAATRKSFARKAIDVLIDAGLLRKQERVRDDGGQTSNGYELINPTRGSTHMPISTDMPISTPVLNTHSLMPTKQPPCLSGTEDTTIEDTPNEETEEEKTRARDPLTVAWQQAYEGIEMPPALATSLQKLAAECSIAAAIHGIKASAAKEDGRNFKYIAECARNYVPPAKPSMYADYGHTYAVDIPGGVQLQPPAEPTAPKLPPPMAHDDPWQVAVSELSHVLPGSAPHWLEGSYFEQNGELAGVPFYRIVMVTPGADAEWMMRQVEPAVRKKLGGILGKRIVVEFATSNMPTIHADGRAEEAERVAA